ncbi:MAG: PAS domain-containing protein [Thermoplasmatota archaeon]
MQKSIKENQLQSPLSTKQYDARYKTLFEQVNAAAFLTTINGEIIEANQKSCDMFGYEWNEFLRLSLHDILSKNIQWDTFREDIVAKGGIRLEVESIRKDGRYLPAELSISLFKLDSKPMMFVLLWDISHRKQAEEKLKESEKKYRGLFEYTTDGTIVLDARGNIVDVNTKICQLLDMRKEQFKGKNLFNMDLLTSTSLPVVVQQFEFLLSEKTAKSFKTEIKNSHATILNVEISSFFLVKQDNEVDNFVLIIRDITDEIKNEKTHIIERNLLKTLMDTITDCIYFKDIKNKYIMVNKAQSLQFNLTPQQMIGKTDFDLLPHEYARKHYIDEKSIILSKTPIIDREEKIVAKDGSLQWVSITKAPWYNEEGELIGTMGIARDITKYKQQIDSQINKTNQ